MFFERARRIAFGGAAILLAGLTSPILAQCSSDYYQITLDPASAAIRPIKLVASENGGYSALATRDEEDRRLLVSDPTVTAADKAKAILWLDANIRAARCLTALTK